MTDTQRYLSGELSHRLAAIDIGTNSIRLIVAEAIRGGNYRILDEERVSTRLGRQLQSSGKLANEAVEESLTALHRFKQIAESFQPQRLKIIATCAVREAKNGVDFCRRAKEELELDIEVITAEKEAHLAFFSVQRSFDLADRNIVLADIGGGSTEIVLASGNMVEAVYTTKLGAVRMSEIYGSGQSMIGNDFDRLTKGIKRQLRKKTKKADFTPHLLIGSGGTFTSLATMVMARKNQEGLPVRGYQVTHAELRHLLDQLRKQPPKDRRSTPGLSPERADIIVAGLAIVDSIMRRFKINMLQVHNRGVRDGLLLTMLERMQGGQRSRKVDRLAAIERFATACGVELEHGRHAAHLANQIFAQLADPFGLQPQDKTVLDAAARLQDVGYLINYERHHKHSYHLILNSRLQGFKPHELELIANVARYHRGAEPKKKHANFKQLGSKDRARVRKLAAILRIASGLDRSHNHHITGCDLTINPQDMELRVYSEEYPDVDIWDARRRVGLFDKVFKTSLTIEWGGQQPEKKQDDENLATEDATPSESPLAKPDQDSPAEGPSEKKPVEKQEDESLKVSSSLPR